MSNIRANSGIISKQSETRYTVTYKDTNGNELFAAFSTHAKAEAFCKANNLGC